MVADLPIPGFGARREAREEALSVLYEVEMAGHSVQEALNRRIGASSEYLMRLVIGVSQDTHEVDTVIGRHLLGWKLARLAVIDRVLARIATWELMYSLDVPTGVVLSEVVSLATQYCGSETPRFLNGVLGAVADDVRSAAAACHTVADEGEGAVS